MAAAGLAAVSPGSPGDTTVSPGSNTAAAAAEAGGDLSRHGSSSSTQSPRLAPAAGWWGPAAVAAMAAMDQQPMAAVEAMDQQQSQLSVILSGPEGTLAHGELGQIGGSSSVKSASGTESGPAGQCEGFVEDGSWVLTDAGNSSYDGLGARQGSDQGTGFGGQQVHTVLGVINEDSQEIPKQNQQQQQAIKAAAAPAPGGPKSAAAAAAAAGAAVAAPAGSGDATAQEDQTG